MPRTTGQKLKLLYVMDYLVRETDEEHPVSISRLGEYLAGKGMAAERKSVYDDIETLRDFGLDIVQSGAGRSTAYYVGERDFELPELKLLVDAVQSSRFITHKKTAVLIRKLERLASVHQARQLQRQVVVAGRIKTMNESIYYNVDELHSGVSRDRKIRFRYFDLTVEKTRRYRKEGAYYTVSPYALVWDSENYYLVAYSEEARAIRHYRVDRMTHISLLDQPREGKEAFAEIDLASYSRRVFGMFSGTEEPVRLRFDARMAGAVLDRLGPEAILVPDGEGRFTVTARVVPSPQFFAWLFGLGAMAELLGPEKVVARLRAQLAEVSALYETPAP